jgi:hypothetical protein
MTSLQNQLIDAIVQDNIDFGNLKSWGYNHTLALLESIEDEDALKNVVNEPYVIGMRQTYPLYHAQDKGNTGLVRVLLDFGADPLRGYGPRKFTLFEKEYIVAGESNALHLAIFFHRADVVKAIMEVVEDKKMVSKHLAFAQSELMSGWYTNDPSGTQDMKKILEMLS